MMDGGLSGILHNAGVWVGVGSAVLAATLTIGGLKADVENIKTTQVQQFQMIQSQLQHINDKLDERKSI